MALSIDSLPVAPQRLFASDNASGVHPQYLAAIAQVNDGHVLAYGNDRFTREAIDAFKSLCNHDVEVLFCFGGTGANVTALSILLDRAESVLCSRFAHIAVDETGAPERILGVKLQTVDTDDGKITPADIHAAALQIGNVHHVQPGVVSISQPTELGTLYSVEEITSIVDAAHRYNMRVHVDGARIANAVAALGGADMFALMTFDAGVDAVSFGGTKNAMLNAEAVLVASKFTANRGAYLRKQSTQLPSKMRFIAAQFSEGLSSGLWLETASAANSAAMTLYNSLIDISSLSLAQPPVNSLYPTLVDPHKSDLQKWSFFWDWDLAGGQVRWMTSWDTTSLDISRFSTGVRHVLTS